MRLTIAMIHDLLDRHDLAPSKALGQNFMVDHNTIDKTVRLARVGSEDHVVEIGPGLGALTVALAEAANEVVAVEADQYILPALGEVLNEAGASNVDVLHADATTMEWASQLDASHKWKLVANLPYNVATGLVLDILDRVPAITELTFLIQKEVGDRLVAPAGSRTYGIPSVRVAYWGAAQIVAQVPPTVFHPQPRVDSTLVRIVRHETLPAQSDPKALFGLVRVAFGQRRKMLRKSLKGLVSDQQFAAAEIDPSERPENLDLMAWDRLTVATRK